MKLESLTKYEELSDANALAAYDEELDAADNAFANNDEELAAATKDTHIVPKKNDVKEDKPEEPAVESTTLEAPPSLPLKSVKKKFAVKENIKDTHIVPKKTTVTG